MFMLSFFSNYSLCSGYHDILFRFFGGPEKGLWGDVIMRKMGLINFLRQLGLQSWGSRGHLEEVALMASSSVAFHGAWEQLPDHFCQTGDGIGLEWCGALSRSDSLERAPRSAMPKAPTRPSKKKVIKLRVTKGLRKWFLISTLWEVDHAFHNTQWLAHNQMKCAKIVFFPFFSVVNPDLRWLH